MTNAHIYFMQEALKLAKEGLGQVWPNPTVGCVIVKDGEIIGRGNTANGGRPHAEPLALNDAGKHATDATLYVTLEPCAHRGQTPPCTDAIINAGITRCVIACRDPHKKVDGKGVKKLREAGIEVIENICNAEARRMNQGFFSLVEKNRPFIALKIATSEDGKITYPPSSSKRWITGDVSRKHVHELRSQYDAILTGIGTVLADDPELTCRLEGKENKSPMRIVLDRNHRLPADCTLMQTKNKAELWVLDCNTIEETIAVLAEKGITRLLVEAGQGLNTAFIQSGLVDQLHWYTAPVTIGGEGLSAFSDPECMKLLENWEKLGYCAFPPDKYEILERKPCSPAS